MHDATDNPKSHDGNWYVLVAGLRCPDSPLTLAPGVTLRRLHQHPSVFDLAAAGARGFKYWAVLEPMSKACTAEIETAKDSALSPGYDTLNRAWLASALLVLRGYTRHLGIACSSYSWNLVAGHTERMSTAFKKQLSSDGVDAAVFKPKKDLPLFKGDLLDYHLQFLTNADAKSGSVTSDDAAWIYEHFQTFNSLASESQSFRFALEAAIDWRYAKDRRSAIARIWSGIEAVFGVTSELVYRISIMSACLLEERGEARKEKFFQVKKLYGLRSKVVHGEHLSEDRITSALNDSFKLLSDLLLLTISRGHLLTQDDFDEAVFGQ